MTASPSILPVNAQLYSEYSGRNCGFVAFVGVGSVGLRRSEVAEAVTPGDVCTAWSGWHGEGLLAVEWGIGHGKRLGQVDRYDCLSSYSR